MSDNTFVNHPLDKLMNRGNLFSRVDRLEGRAGARPSASAVQLGQIAANTGNLVVDGSIVVVNRNDGIPDITIDDNGILVRNQEGALYFEDTSGNRFRLSISSGGTNDLQYTNDIPGAGHIFNITMTDLSSAPLVWSEDPANANVAQLKVFPGIAGASLVVGSLFAADGVENRVEVGADHYFPARNASNPNGFWNEANQDMDFTFEGVSGDVLKVDAGTNSVIVNGITNGTGLAHGTYTPTLTNVANITASSVANPFMYMRVGNVVHVAGRIAATHDGSGDGQVRFTLPIASDLADTDDLTGNATNAAAVRACSIIPDTTNNEAILFIDQNVGVGSIGWRIVFMYLVL